MRNILLNGFIGVRASESASRSEYDYVSLGEKHKGQYSCNPILEWNSAELYIYIYMQSLLMNEAYRKGNRRVGCLVCPRAAERNDYMSRVWYPNEFDALIGTVRSLYKNSFQSSEKLDEFMANGGWKARKNGRDISIDLNYTEAIERGMPTIKINHPKTDWKIWINTIGTLLNDSTPYRIIFRNEQYTFDVHEEEGGICVSYSPDLPQKNPLFVKLLKNVFRKSACCIRCRESIVGMAVALKKNCELLNTTRNHIFSLERRLIANLEANGIEFLRNGSQNHIPGNISLSFPGRDGEALLHRLDLMGICVSTGSACDSTNTQISHVLQAIGLEEYYAKGTIRISLGKNNTTGDVEFIADALTKILK